MADRLGLKIPNCAAARCWFEEPSTHHLLAKNSSTTEPAKLLAVFNF